LASSRRSAAPAKESAAALLTAPPPVVWKLRLRAGIAGVIAALGAGSLGELDAAWDASQRRLFHRIAAGVGAEDGAVRAASARAGLWQRAHPTCGPGAPCGPLATRPGPQSSAFAPRRCLTRHLYSL
jgi:hypothetical protein